MGLYNDINGFILSKSHYISNIYASVVELVDTIDSKSIVLWDMSVQIGSEVPILF